MCEVVSTLKIKQLYLSRTVRHVVGQRLTNHVLSVQLTKTALSQIQLVHIQRKYPENLGRLPINPKGYVIAWGPTGPQEHGGFQKRQNVNETTDK